MKLFNNSSEFLIWKWWKIALNINQYVLSLLEQIMNKRREKDRLKEWVSWTSNILHKLLPSNTSTLFTGYHADRVDETCDFIDSLLEHGANPKAMNNSGETAPHLCVNTLEFRIMSRFIEHLGKAIKSSGLLWIWQDL